MFLALLFCLTFSFSPGGLFEITTNHASSIADIKSLVDMETSIIGELSKYTKALKDKINTIESFIEEVKAKREISTRNPDEFVAHPLNAFALIRRLHEDWTYMEVFMSRRESKVNLQAIQETLRKGQPTVKDMRNALKGIAKMQRSFNQEAVDMARGVLLGGHQYRVNMTTLECLYIAQNCERTGDSKGGISWYKAALQQYDELRDGQVYREVFGFKVNEIYKNLSTALRKSASVDVLRDVSDLDAELNEILKAGSR